MCEDLYQVWRRIKDYTDLMASNMTIDNAVLFIQAWFSANYADQTTSIEIRRQPMMDYKEEGE